MNLKTLFAVTAIFFSPVPPANAADAAMEPARWSGPTVHRSFKARFQSQSITIRYEIHQGGRLPSSNVIIHFCGGPGVTCIPYGRPAEIPAGFDYVLFDYPGLGQNSSLPGPNNIEGISRVALMVVQRFARKNVILYGHSFGTAIATVVASKLSGTRPQFIRGLILEGTIGAGPRAQGPDLIGPSKIAWQSLTDGERAEFRDDFSQVLNAMTATEKILFLQHYIYETLSNGTKSAVEGYRSFINNYKEQGKDALLMFHLALMGCKDRCDKPLRTEPNQQDYVYFVPGCQVFNLGQAN